jgi:hypothetical protein
VEEALDTSHASQVRDRPGHLLDLLARIQLAAEGDLLLVGLDQDATLEAWMALE